MKQSVALLEYTIVDLSRMPHFLPSQGAEIIAYAKQVASMSGNRPVELRGNTVGFVAAQVLVQLMHVATEITYRPTAEEFASIVFSQLGKDVERPYDVIPTDAWQSAITDERSLGLDVPEFIVDMGAMWKKAHDTHPTYELSMYLKEVTEISPRIPKVILIGEDVPLLPLFWTVHWFYPYAKELWYHGIQLS